MMKYILTTTILLLLLVSCNKEKRFSNRLIKGEEWEVKKISYGGQEESDKGVWFISEDSDIYEAVPQAIWTFQGEDAVLNWQFQENGDSFQLQYLQLCEECTGDELDPLDHFTYDLTGTYKVEKSRRKELILESEETLGYSGQLVKIELERK